jgi:hypothetical protein
MLMVGAGCAKSVAERRDRQSVAIRRRELIVGVIHLVIRRFVSFVATLPHAHEGVARSS